MTAKRVASAYKSKPTIAAALATTPDFVERAEKLVKRLERMLRSRTGPAGRGIGSLDRGRHRARRNGTPLREGAGPEMTRYHSPALSCPACPFYASGCTGSNVLNVRRWTPAGKTADIPLLRLDAIVTTMPRFLAESRVNRQSVPALGRVGGKGSFRPPAALGSYTAGGNYAPRAVPPCGLPTLGTRVPRPR